MEESTNNSCKRLRTETLPVESEVANKSDDKCAPVARELSKVFYTLISRKLLVDVDKRVLHLEKVIDVVDKRLSFFERILPPCMLKFENEDDMYCCDCNNPLTCCDFKQDRFLRNCSMHRKTETCCECEEFLCEDCIESCEIYGHIFCKVCFDTHGESCLCCRNYV